MIWVWRTTVLQFSCNIRSDDDKAMMMKRYSFLRKMIGCCALGMGFGACDSGDIFPDQNDSEHTRKIETVCVLERMETIPTARERKLMWAAFKKKDDLQPLRSERITTAVTGDSVTVTLTQVPEDAAYVALVLTDQTSKVLYVFYGEEIATGNSEVKIDAGRINLVSFDRLQHQLFNQSCLQCHMSGNASAGLVLEENSSYAAIVGRPSQTDPGKMIIQPGDTGQSEMYLRLTDTEGFHAKFSTLKDDDITLLKTWIETGAKR